MTVRELTADQLAAIGASTGAWELHALVRDPDSTARPAMAGAGRPATATRPAIMTDWRGHNGITGTVGGREVHVTDAELVGWARALPGGYPTRGETETCHRTIQLFTQTRCAVPVDFMPELMTGPQSARTLHVCAVPAIYRDEQVRTLISHAGVPQYGFDFPYPCRWCKRVGYHSSMASRPEVDALADRLRELGVLLEDVWRDADADRFPAELVGQGVLW